MKNGLTECDAGESFGSSIGTSRNIPAHSGLTVTNGSLNSAVADCGCKNIDGYTISATEETLYLRQLLAQFSSPSTLLSSSISISTDSILGV